MSQQADEKYIEHYQLKHDPFQAQVPDFKFFQPQRAAVLTDLHKMARFGVQIQAVTGPQGSGKTLLRKAMLASTDKQQIASVVVVGRDASTAAELLKALASGLGDPQGGDSEAEVREQIALFEESNQQVYLLVDDAEQLGDDALEMLERLAGVVEGEDGMAALHVVLFGALDLLSRLENSGRADLYHLHRLVPYSELETREYLALRLEGAGGDIGLLDDEQIAKIFEESGGWPGTINGVARSVMIEGMHEDEAEAVEEEQQSSVGGLPYRHLMAVAAVAMLVVIAMLFKDPSDESTPAVAQVAPSAQPAVPTPVEGGEKPVVLPLDKVVEVDVQASGRAVTDEPAAPVAEVAPVVADVAAPVRPAAPVEVAPAPVPARPAPAVAPAPVAARPITPARPATPAPAPVAPAPAPVAAAKAVAGSGSGNGIWYMSQPGSNYTLQLMAVSKEPSAQRVVADGGAEYRYFSKTVAGKSLYIVTWGNFRDRAAALAAVSRLPKQFQSGKPVPQSMDLIQKYIRQVR